MYLKYFKKNLSEDVLNVLKNVKGSLYLLGFFSLLVFLLELMLPAILGSLFSIFQESSIVSDVISKFQFGFLKKYSYVEVVLLLSIVYAILRYLIQIKYIKLRSTLVFKITSLLAENLFAKFCYSSPIARGASKKVIRRKIVDETNEINWQLMIPLCDFVVESMILLGLIFLVIFFAPIEITYLIILMGGVYYIFMRLNKKDYKKIGKEKIEIEQAKDSIVKIAASGATSTLYMVNKKWLVGYMIQLFADSSRIMKNLLIALNRPRPTMELIFLSLFCFFIYILHSSDVKDEAILTLVVLGGGALRVGPSASRINSSINSIRYGLTYLDSVIEMTSILSQATPSIKQKTPIDNIVKIEFNLISKIYHNKRIFNPISMLINKGDSVAIKGASGAGKSTLLGIISNSISPSSGEILLHSKDHIVSPIEGVFFISGQNNDILNRSLMDNLTLGQDINIKEDTIMEAMIRLGFNSSRVGELLQSDDVKSVISGGEAKRISVLRSLFHKRNIYIFDEPTSGLDPENSKRVINFIYKNKHPFLFIVSHNETDLTFCNKNIQLA
mgnify:CR=1 FL=1